MFISLVAAWLVGSVAFGVAWLRFSAWDKSTYIARHALLEFGILIGILVFAVGLPLAWAASRRRLVLWWSASGIASAIGALLGGLTTASKPDNPFSLSFSPWHRDRPGAIGEFEIPWSAADTWGSIASGAIIGAILGGTFWFFYVRLGRPR